jgi:hypothetical protein
MSWMQAGMLAGEKYAKGGKVKPPTKAQKAAAAATISRAKSRPEYLAAMASQKALESMRASIAGGILRGGRGGPGTGGSTIVQHTTTINVKVEGSVRSDMDLARKLQNIFVQNRMPLSLPPGR